VALPLQLLISFGHTPYELSDLQSAIQSTSQMGASLVPFFYGVASAWLIFFWLFKTRSAYFYASLPVRRETVFLTDFCAGLVLGLFPNLLIFLLTLGSTALLGSFQPLACAQWLASGCLSFLFFYSFAVVCCMVIGHVAAMPLLYLVLNFTVYVLDYIVRILLKTFVFGMPDQTGVLASKLSPLVYLLSGSVGPRAISVYDETDAVYRTVGYTFTGWRYLLILGGVGLVFAVASFFLYRSREMERSGDVVTVRALRPVFLYFFTVGSALVLGDGIMYLLGNQTLTANFIPVLICLLAGAFLGYAAAQMMLQKTLRVFSHGWWGYLAVCLCLILTFGAARLDLFGYSRRVPSSDEVLSASISTYRSAHDDVPYTDPDAIAATIELHSYLIEHQNEVEPQLRELGKGFYTNGYQQDFYLTYTLKNGETIERKYSAAVTAETENDPDSLLSHFTVLYNSTPAVLARCTPDWDVKPGNFTYCSINGPTDSSGSKFDTVYLSSDDAYRFYTECLLPDLKDSSLGSTSFSLGSAEKTETWNPVTVTLDLTDAFGNTVNFNYTVTADAARTIAYLETLGFCPLLDQG